MNDDFVVKSTLEWRFDENDNLLGFEADMLEGNVRRKLYGIFDYEKKRAVMTTEINGTKQIDEIDIVNNALSELQLEKKIQNSGLKIGNSFSYITFLPDFGKYCHCKITINSLEDIVIMNKELKLYKLVREVDGIEQKLIIWMDSCLTPWISELIWPKRIFRIERTYKKDAVSLRSAFYNNTDMFDNASINLKINEKFASELDLYLSMQEKIQKVVFKIKHLPYSHNLQGGTQKIISKDHDSILLEINTDYSDIENTGNNSPNFNLKSYLEPNIYIQSENSKINEIAIKLIDAKSKRKTALKIQKWVNNNIKWCSDFGFSTAVSTLEAGCGDCTELSVLTAALCRSVDIPSRVAMGYIVKKNLMGETILAPHMWIEIWFNNTWVPIDSTSDSQFINPFKIRFLSSSLHRDEMYRFLDLYSKTSNVEVELVSIVYITQGQLRDIQNKNKGGKR